MARFKSFADFLELRAAVTSSSDPGSPSLRHDPADSGAQSTDDPESPTLPGDQVAERSMFRGVFKAVNPSRPVSPMNSKLLASPSRKRKLGSQVMGRRQPGA